MVTEQRDEGIQPTATSGTMTKRVSSGETYPEEKPRMMSLDPESSSMEQRIERELNVTEDDLLEAREAASSMSLEEVISLMKNVVKIHERDPNFPHAVLLRIDEFLKNDDLYEHPEKHESLIYEMKLEAALITNNSPYSEVRAVVDNKDDPSLPCSTIRAWTIGIIFSVAMAFVNQLFSVRQPPIVINSNVAQLLAFPIGKAWERWMPNANIKLGKKVIPLNPGRFNKKEHMMIAIMANTSMSLPYTQFIIWSQVMPQYFNQQYARDFGYQILIALSTNFIGYGLAGLTRRFIVYPAYCVWPASLVTIALNSALHDDTKTTVLGPMKKLFSMSRYRFFMLAFAAMFVYFWFPNYIFIALSYFSWMTWISPNNHNLSVLTGFNGGTGLFNFFPTFDWNILLFDLTDPLMVPAFSTFNRTLGMFVAGLVILAVYFTNTWNTGYIPILSNLTFDHFGGQYNVSQTLDERGFYDHDKYMEYSAVYLSAGKVISYACFFGMYTATIVHVILFHRFEIVLGFKNLWKVITRKKDKDSATDGEYKDIHNKLMAAYPEVSEWYYLAILVTAAGLGFAGVGAWPTYTTLAVVPYGIILALIFVVPVGIIKAMTGVEVLLNILAEFIGGMWVEGNALAMNYFKTYGYITCSAAVNFANDLKVAHYLKISPPITFAAQMIATLIATFVSCAVMQFQVDMEGICTPEAPMRLYCPGPNSFFTASITWGTIGPLKIFGINGQYAALLLGFPLGVITPLIFYGLVKWLPRNKYLRQFHPVALWYGGVLWAPYSFSYAWPAVPIAWLSWIYVKNRYLAFWSKYNFVLSAAFSAAIAIAGVIMLFSVQWAEKDIIWWGNTQPLKGCETTPCTLKTLDIETGERFYPWWDGKSVPAPGLET